jgi:Flp pilus assembly protein TadG
VRKRRGSGDAGQAAVELALVLPLVAVLALALVQVGLVVRDQVLVTHAAREAVRAAAVDPAPSTPRDAARRASGLDTGRLTVEVVGRRGAPGQPVTIRVRYKSKTAVPLVGALVRDVTLSGTATMRVEQ